MFPQNGPTTFQNFGMWAAPRIFPDKNPDTNYGGFLLFLPVYNKSIISSYFHIYKVIIQLHKILSPQKY